MQLIMGRIGKKYLTASGKRARRKKYLNMMNQQHVSINFKYLLFYYYYYIIV